MNENTIFPTFLTKLDIVNLSNFNYLTLNIVAFHHCFNVHISNV